MSTTDLVAELRWASWGDGLSYVHELMGTAAEEIERLTAENARLRGLWRNVTEIGAVRVGDPTSDHVRGCAGCCGNWGHA